MSSDTVYCVSRLKLTTIRVSIIHLNANATVFCFCFFYAIVLRRNNAIIIRLLLGDVDQELLQRKKRIFLKTMQQAFKPGLFFCQIEY